MVKPADRQANFNTSTAHLLSGDPEYALNSAVIVLNYSHGITADTEIPIYDVEIEKEP